MSAPDFPSSPAGSSSAPSPGAAGAPSGGGVAVAAAARRGAEGDAAARVDYEHTHLVSLAQLAVCLEDRPDWIRPVMGASLALSMLGASVADVESGAAAVTDLLYCVETEGIDEPTRGRMLAEALQPLFEAAIAGNPELTADQAAYVVDAAFQAYYDILALDPDDGVEDAADRPGAAAPATAGAAGGAPSAV